MCILFLLKREFSTGYNYRVSKIPFSLDFYNVDIQEFIYKPKIKKNYEVEID